MPKSALSYSDSSPSCALPLLPPRTHTHPRTHAHKCAHSGCSLLGILRSITLDYNRVRAHFSPQELHLLRARRAHHNNSACCTAENGQRLLNHTRTTKAISLLGRGIFPPV